MKDLKGKVAVITGAASGIGLAFVQRCLKEGMRVVLADIDKSLLRRLERSLKKENALVLAVPTDVSKAEDVKTLCDTTYEQFAATDILFNNAGVSTIGYTHSSALTSWKWVLGVNLFGAIHGIHYFVPRMIKQDSECHVINTASLSGLTIAPAAAPYSVSKAAVVMLTETLFIELQALKSKVKASVVCPGFIATNITQSENHRPEEFQNPHSPGPSQEQASGLMMMLNLVKSGTAPKDAANIAFKDKPLPKGFSLQDAINMGAFAHLIETGMTPQECANIIFREAIQEEKFYILPNATMPIVQDAIRKRMDNLLKQKSPEPSLPSWEAYRAALKKD